MKSIIELEIPEDVLKHAKDSGISIKEFKRSMEMLGTMQLASETSRLDRKGAEIISGRIKAGSWKKITRSLNL